MADYTQAGPAKEVPTIGRELEAVHNYLSDLESTVALIENRIGITEARGGASPQSLSGPAPTPSLQVAVGTAVVRAGQLLGRLNQVAGRL